MEPATRADAPVIGRVLADALSDKYGPTFDRAAPTALSAMAEAAVAHGPAGYLVARIDGELAGVAFLDIGQPKAPIWRPLVASIGVRRSIRALLVLEAFAKSRTGPDEAHLDELAVAPGFRRRGVASALIEDVTARASAAGKSRLTLWVTGDNTGAQRLYARHGFRVEERQRWLIGRLLFGSRGALKMARPIP
jgi:ribosomal protein S18 acetylase RimI-like enzyme